MNLFIKQKQTQRHKKINLWLPKGKGERRDKLVIRKQQIQTTINNKVDRQQGPTVQNIEPYSISYNKL